MTSKISFYSLRLENVKHRIGMILITFFSFFAYILCFLMSVQNICGVQGSKFKDNLMNITRLSEPGTDLGMVALLSAVLLAISAFRYLHVKTEVDFYHSLPVKRREILYMILTNDIVIFVVPLILTSIIKCTIVLAVGYLTKAFLLNTIWSILCYIAVFAITYLTMSLAMIMTGNTFVGILGFGVFECYIPLLIRPLYPELASKFYKTYWADTEWGGIFDYFSPLSLSTKLLECPGTWEWKTQGKYFAVICVWICLLLVLNYVLFEKRSSEMAGKAMAFSDVKPVIRILLVIPASIWVGLILYSVSFTYFKPWIIAGIVIGGFFGHGIIECIYRFDVRGLWAHKRQMLICMAVSFVIVGFFWLDVGGYDDYLPDEEEAASIVIDSPDIGVTDEFFWGKERTGVTGETMKNTRNILQDVIDQNDKNVKDYWEGTNNSGDYSSCVIKYRLKNGKEKIRSYTLNSDLQDRLMAQVFDTEEYRKDTYSLYTADWSLVTNVSVIYPTSYDEVKMTKEQRAELFRIYLEEFSKLDYETVKTTLPFGQLVITHKNKNSVTDILSSDYRDDVMEDYYYLYPSFKKTIKYLRDELKIDIKTSLKDIDIVNLEIAQYDEGTAEVDSFEIFDKEFIDSVKEKMICGDNMSITIPGCSIDNTIDITANIGTDSIVVYTDSETIQKILEYKNKK